MRWPPAPVVYVAISSGLARGTVEIGGHVEIVAPDLNLTIFHLKDAKARQIDSDVTKLCAINALDHDDGPLSQEVQDLPLGGRPILDKASDELAQIIVSGNRAEWHIVIDTVSF